MKVTIVTPSYNQGEFIEETIKSVLSQTYPDIEYIIMDGGSTDNSVEIIKKYETDPRVSWVSEKDEGQTNAINKGFNRAVGEILAWLNSDDLFEHERVIEMIVKEFENDPGLDLLYGKCNYTNVAGEVIGEFESKPYDFERLLNHDCGMIPQASCFFTKRVIEKIGGLDESLNYSMDYDLWIRIGQVGKVKYIEQMLSRFRQHDDCKTVKTVNHSRRESWYVSRKNKGKFFSPLFFRLVYTAFKEVLGEKDLKSKKWYAGVK